MRKGSLLIALSLLLAMMMGMSVHAREAQMYDLGIESDMGGAGHDTSYPGYIISLTPYTPEPTPEPAPDNSNNDVNVEDNKEEPKVEELLSKEGVN